MHTYAFSSDNEIKMIKVRDILQIENTDFITYGCFAYYVNLLVGDITNKDVLKQITEVQKYFRNHHQPHG